MITQFLGKVIKSPVSTCFLTGVALLRASFMSQKQILCLDVRQHRPWPRRMPKPVTACSWHFRDTGQPDPGMQAPVTR